MREQVAKLSRGHDLTKAFNYVLKRWASFTLFLEDGLVCLSNNAAGRRLRGIALGRKSWEFCGSDRGARRAAAMYSLIVSAKMNGVERAELGPAISFHVLPHTWASLAVMAGVPLLVVARNLGHADTRMVETHCGIWRRATSSTRSVPQVRGLALKRGGLQ
jgi:integrase